MFLCKHVFEGETTGGDKGAPDSVFSQVGVGGKKGEGVIVELIWTAVLHLAFAYISG